MDIEYLLYALFIFQTSSPASGKMTALGWYLSFSLFFVVAAMVEFAVVMILKHKMAVPHANDKKNAAKKQNRVNVIAVKDMLDPINNILQQIDKSDPIMVHPSELHDNLSTNNKIDNVSFVLFPTTFIVFNIIYIIAYHESA